MFPDCFATDRMHLRPIVMADAEPILQAYATDPAVTRFLTWRPHRGIEDTQAYIAYCLAAPADQSRTYILLGKTNDGVRGAIELRRTGPNRMGFGYVLARRWWGQGLATEMLSVLVNWGLSQPEIFRVGDVCDVDNAASARVMEKAGLLREGLLRRWAVHPNLGLEPRDCVIYARVR